MYVRVRHASRLAVIATRSRTTATCVSNNKCYCSSVVAAAAVTDGVDVRYRGDSDVMRAAVPRRRGVVVQWHPVERRGVIREVVVVSSSTTGGSTSSSGSETTTTTTGSGHEYAIASARAFETALPSLLWDLVGATVTFVADTQPCADRVIVRTRREHITARSYERAPPIDFARYPLHSTYLLPTSPPLSLSSSSSSSQDLLPPSSSSLHATQGQGGSSSSSDHNDNAMAATRALVDASAAHAATSTRGDDDTTTAATTTTTTLYAKDIVVDLCSLTDAQRARVRGPLLGDGAGGDDAVPPTRYLKDLRNRRVLDRDTDMLLRLRRRLGHDEAAVSAAMAQYRAATAPPRRRVVATRVRGCIVAWSPLHRSGLVLDDDDNNNNNSETMPRADDTTKVADAVATAAAAEAVVAASNTPAQQQQQHCIIRNAHSFDTALSTWSALLRCRVTYDKVTYASQPDKYFAEHIVVDEDERAHATTTMMTVTTTTGAMHNNNNNNNNNNNKGDGTRTPRRAQHTRPSMTYYADEDGDDDDDDDDVDDDESGSSNDSTDDNDDAAVRYGVIVRWSGGNGVIYAARRQRSGRDDSDNNNNNNNNNNNSDSNDNTTCVQGDATSPPPRRRRPRQRVRYYIRSAAAFVQLVDVHSRALRGAVVRFRVDRECARYARDVDIVSSAASSPHTYNIGTSTQQQQHDNSAGGEQLQSASSSSSTCAPRHSRSDDRDDEVAALVWHEGVLLSYSPHEGQGIIVVADKDNDNNDNNDNDDNNNNDDDADKTKQRSPRRFVLRDAAECVVDYATRKPLLHKGRRVRFSTRGERGCVAVCVHMLASDNVAEDDELLRAAELRAREPRLTLDGNAHEAIASPLSTHYWVARLEKVGFDVSDVRQRQRRQMSPSNNSSKSSSSDSAAVQGSDTTHLDSEDAMKADAWWHDPRKNLRFPGSHLTAGHMALVGPASMLNTAIKARDPAALHAMTRKYEARMTEEQRAYAMQQAKELAPKYEALVKQARERNEEPTFYYF